MSSSSPIRRDVGPFALMLTGLGSIIGSGWLFGAWKAAGLAGPGAVWAWVLGAAIITTIALTYAELGSMFPESGGMVRYSHYSHGSLVGFIGAWANWIAIVSVIPVEAEASVQYMAGWKWQWAQDLYMHVPGGHGELTPPGLAIAAVLVIVYFLLNFWSVKLFARSNTAITVFKLVVPAATGLALIASGFHRENFSVGVHGDAHAIDFAAVLSRGDRRHRVQLQRLPEPGEPSRRSAQPGQEHPVRGDRLDPAGHRGLCDPADRLPRRGAAGDAGPSRLARHRLQLAVRAAGDHRQP